MADNKRSLAPTQPTQQTSKTSFAVTESTSFLIADIR